MTLLETLILGSYFFVLVILGLYGWHRYYLVYAYMKNKDRVPGPPPAWDGPLPPVTIQLPIYNEMYVVDRLLQATARIDYPKELLEIQVLDDSTDETTEVARACGRAACAAQGFDVKYLHRTDRTGFKAGALDEGLKVARGQFVAIFDADFIPERGLPAEDRAALPRPEGGAGAGALGPRQRRLLAADEGPGHPARRATSCSSTAAATARATSSTSTARPGVWRREVIPAAGGWQHDTLTEDLDLSYRAQLLGWKFLFLPDLVAPAEVPVEMNAFKSQQHRWAKGSIQVCLKLLPRILQSDQPFGVKAEAFFHLTANFNYLLMSLLSILMFPSMVIRYNMGWYEMLLIDVPLFFAATASVANFYVVSQRELYPDWKTRLRYMPFLMSVGIGLAVNNTRAVLEALFHHESAFARTPKYGIERGSDQWAGKKYQQAVAIQPLIEIALGLYFTMTVFYALA